MLHIDAFETELIAVAWFNSTRLHESLSDIPPAEIETLYAIQSA